MTCETEQEHYHHFSSEDTDQMYVPNSIELWSGSGAQFWVSWLLVECLLCRVRLSPSMSLHRGVYGAPYLPCAEQLDGSICEFQDLGGSHSLGSERIPLLPGYFSAALTWMLYPDSSMGLVLPPASLLPSLFLGNVLHSGHLSSVTVAWILIFLAHWRSVSNSCWP